MQLKMSEPGVSPAPGRQHAWFPQGEEGRAAGCSLVQAMLTGGQRCSRDWKGGFPGGPAVRIWPARAGDIGLIPVQEDPTGWAQISLCPTTIEPVC